MGKTEMRLKRLINGKFNQGSNMLGMSNNPLGKSLMEISVIIQWKPHYTFFISMILPCSTGRRSFLLA